MSDIRQEWDDFYGTCCVEYCHICHNGGQLDPCPHCNFLFCTMHKSHDCIRKPKPSPCEESMKEIEITFKKRFKMCDDQDPKDCARMYIETLGFEVVDIQDLNGPKPGDIVLTPADFK